MKIGILTFHRAHNYGAVLQCYALQEFLRKKGHDVGVVDYKLPYLLDCYKPLRFHRFVSKNPFRMVKRALKELQVLKARFRRYHSFDTFIESRFNLYPTNSMETYDLIIIGSDQVWNTMLTKGFDPYYWAQFRRSYTKVISYGASIEQFWEDEDDFEAARLLNGFDGISVRESDAAEKLKNICPQKDVNVVVDPTLLVGKELWNQLAVKPLISSPYVLYYQVRPSKRGLNVATAIAKEKNLKLICLSARVDDLNSRESISASPEEFLGWFRYASFVVCTSFHGTVFSVVFNVPFLSIRLNDGKDSRVINFLNKINLESHLVENVPLKYGEINFKDVEANLNLISESSKMYINKFIQ